ncbi:MAG: hypothetical protein WA152_00515 [Microgenomates group bacterium]
MEEQVEATKHKGKSSFKFFGVILVLIIAGAGYGGAYYYYNQYKETKIVLDNPEVASQNEVKEITDKLGKIYELPKDEEPTVATVLDMEKLKDQPFFSNAQNGDKVIIYTKSQLAILFRVDANKIITVAPVAIDQQAAPETDPEATELPAKKDTSTPEPTE